MSIAKHGKITEYYHRGCRCDECRKGAAEYNFNWRRSNIGREPLSPHGTVSTYLNYFCRCPACKKAQADAVKAQRQKRIQAPKDPNDKRHGTASFYTNHGCRCDSCASAYAKQKVNRSTK